MNCGFCRRAGLDECYCSSEATERFRTEEIRDALKEIAAFGCDDPAAVYGCGKCQACLATRALRL